ncbi:MAG: TetR family transcriptional regulator C-terminal domain-containing protein, partial [Hyphomicrobiaceae bacterium]
LPDDWESYEGSPIAQLGRLMGGYVFRTSSDRFWRFWINYTARSTRDEDMRRRQAERFERQRSFWAKLIADGIEQGIFRPDLDSEMEAERLLLIAHGLIVRQILSPDPTTRDLARRILDKEINALCG